MTGMMFDEMNIHYVEVSSCENCKHESYGKCNIVNEEIPFTYTRDVVCDKWQESDEYA
jgi:hypothetical protein